MLNEELELAIEAARAAGEAAMRWFRSGVDVERKADGSPVTRADREAEAAAREVIAGRFPDDGILGEESGETAGDADRRWVLDPIDGTRSFIHGVPLFGTLVALESGGDPVVGVIHLPALGETVYAARGGGCWWVGGDGDGQPARVSDTSTIDDALVLTSGDGLFAADPDLAAFPDPGFAARVAGLHRLAGRAGVVRTWGDCYGYALVATGRAEAMLDPVLHVWDAAAVRPIIEEAGGVFTDWAGAATHRSPHTIATNAALAGEVRRLAGADR